MDLARRIDAAGDDQEAPGEGAACCAHEVDRIGFGGPVREEIDTAAAGRLRRSRVLGDERRRSVEARRMADRTSRKWKIAGEVAENACRGGEIGSAEDAVDAERPVSGDRTIASDVVHNFKIRRPLRRIVCTSVRIVAADTPTSLNPMCRIPRSHAAWTTDSASSMVRSLRVSINMKSMGASRWAGQCRTPRGFDVVTLT
jgi:hypothetical protein